MKKINFKKKYGQNFLINENISHEIIKLEEIKKRNILEVGPGNMALTKIIAKKNPKKFFSIEIDKDIYKNYQESYLSKYLINDDAQKINELNLFKKKNFSIISNLPFNISTVLLIKWLKLQNQYNCIDSMILMFQKELAEKIIASENSKNYGRISILSNAFFKIEKKINVKKENFYPIPKVDAVVLQFLKLKSNKIRKEHFSNLEKITMFFFNERRKKNYKKIKKIFNSKQIEDLKLDKYYDMRPENLKKEVYYKFSKLL